MQSHAGTTAICMHDTYVTLYRCAPVMAHEPCTLPTATLQGMTQELGFLTLTCPWLCSFATALLALGAWHAR